MNRNWKHWNKVPYLLLFVLIIIATIVLFYKEEKELIIMSRDSVISAYHSDNNEVFRVELLANDEMDYHFKKEYIASSRFVSEDNEIGLELQEIHISQETILYQNQEFYQITLLFKLPFVANDLEIMVEDVILEIDYMNDTNLRIEVGEFNYLFQEDLSSDISLNNLSATHEIVNGYNTIGGINIELGNLKDANIVITDIRILSSGIFFNKEYIRIQEPCAIEQTVAYCLNLDNYDFEQESTVEELNLVLRKNNTIELFIPLSYPKKYSFIYEFSFVITYELNQEEHMMVIDDFPYIYTSIFSDYDEENMHVYIIQD